MDFISNPYRGPSNVPHVSEDFFKMFFVGSNLAFTMVSLPGRFFGTEVRSRRHNRDYMMRVCEEAAITREVRRKKVPKFYYKKPMMTKDSWQKMWWKHLQWQSWSVDRTGPCYPAT